MSVSDHLYGYKYSVLMSVYHKENGEHLKAAMNSIWDQTVKTDDFVLVCDGPLNAELDAVIEEMEGAHSELRVFRLDKNRGLGNALNIGIKHCKNELVARMDSDDISRPERCEKQLGLFYEKPELSIVSGTVEEFSLSVNEVESCRVLPERHDEIVEFAKKRNPFNHPCVMYKKSDVVAAGGYQDFYLLEDYYLWIRMLQKGYVGYNLQQPLLWMRAGAEMYKRRSGWKYAKSQQKLFRYMKERGIISGTQYLVSTVSRNISSLLPNTVRKLLYRLFIRK